MNQRLSRFFPLMLILSSRAAAPQIFPRAVPFQVGSDLVIVPVTVTDHHGAPVPDLNRSDFRVLDDEVPLPIASFERDRAPVSVLCVQDTSASMSPKMERAQAAVKSLVLAGGPQDEAALLTFSNHPHLHCGFTQNLEAVVQTANSEKPVGETALIDAIWQGLEGLRASHHSRKAVVVITDGGDNHSRHTDSELIRAAQEADAQIYGIAIHEQTFSVAEQAGSDLLKRLSAVTGGLEIEVGSSRQIPQATEKISAAMRSLYLLGFKPADREDGQWHRIRVRLEPAGRKLQVTAKSAYFR
jgi:Ca-activated chloride channel family protein